MVNRPFLRTSDSVDWRTSSFSTTSDRLSDLSQLSLSTIDFPHLLPTNRHHLLPSLADRQHNTKLILRRARKVTPLVSKTDNHAPHDIANSETLIHLDLVNLSGADILLANDS